MSTMDVAEEPESPSTADSGLVTVPKATFIEDVGAFLAGGRSCRYFQLRETAAFLA